MKLFLQHLNKLAEAHDYPRYAYSYVGNQPVPKKHFSDNCKRMSTDIQNSAQSGTSYQKNLLNSIARHVKNENLSLAQDVIDKLDSGTAKLIPKLALDFIRRNS